MENTSSNTIVLEFVPDIGVKPILFGMTPTEVRKALAAEPQWIDESPSSIRKLREDYPELIGVDYGNDGKAYSVSLAPPPIGNIKLTHEGNTIWEKGLDKNPLSYFLTLDDSPYEMYGFVIFDKIGVAVTGYHDGEEDQRAITMYKLGTWPGLKEATRISLDEFKQ